MRPLICACILLVCASCAHNAPVTSPEGGMRAVELYNMLPRGGQGEDADRVNVLSVDFTRHTDGAVESVEVTCKVGDVSLTARPMRYAPGDTMYSAYLYTSRDASTRLREGPQDVRCDVTLDGERAVLKGRVVMPGAPLGTPFELDATPILAIDCETGASPHTGRPMCVQFRARNPVLSVSDPSRPITVACELGGERVTAPTAIGYLGRGVVMARFERAPGVGAHEVTCSLVEHPEVAARARIEVTDRAPTFGVTLLGVSGLKAGVFMCSEAPDCPRRLWEAVARVRVTGDTEVWNVMASCTDPVSGQVIAGQHVVGLPPTFVEGDTRAPAPLPPGTEVTLRITTDVLMGRMQPPDTLPESLECSARIRARKGERVLASTPPKTLSPAKAR